MSSFELRLMHSRAKEFWMRYHEFRVFEGFIKKNNIDLYGKVILDAGCGSGYESKLILERFNPRELVAFDSMQGQISLAEKRGLRAEFFVGDITDIEQPADKFDAVFVFGVLHHVPQWPKALEEINRVLRSGGVFLVEEPNIRFVRFAERFMAHAHPEESGFQWQEFIQGLEDAGFDVLESRKMRIPIASFMWRHLMCVKR